MEEDIDEKRLSICEKTDCGKKFVSLHSGTLDGNLFCYLHYNDAVKQKLSHFFGASFTRPTSTFCAWSPKKYNYLPEKETYL